MLHSLKSTLQDQCRWAKIKVQPGPLPSWGFRDDVFSCFFQLCPEIAHLPWLMAPHYSKLLSLVMSLSVTLIFPPPSRKDPCEYIRPTGIMQDKPLSPNPYSHLQNLFCHVKKHIKGHGHLGPIMHPTTTHTIIFSFPPSLLHFPSFLLSFLLSLLPFLFFFFLSSIL